MKSSFDLRETITKREHTENPSDPSSDLHDQDYILTYLYLGCRRLGVIKEFAISQYFKNKTGKSLFECPVFKATSLDSAVQSLKLQLQKHKDTVEYRCN